MCRAWEGLLCGAGSSCNASGNLAAGRGNSELSRQASVGRAGENDLEFELAIPFCAFPLCSRAAPRALNIQTWLCLKFRNAAREPVRVRLRVCISACVTARLSSTHRMQ